MVKEKNVNWIEEETFSFLYNPKSPLFKSL